SPRFIACDRSLSDGRIIVYGIPFEGRVNLRKGADGGPRDLRLASDSIETYSPWAERDLEDLALADIGDCELPDGAAPRDPVDAERVYQVGMRTGSREEYVNRRPNFYPVLAGHPVEVVRRLLPALRSHPLYVTIDVDVLDPSEAPGTGSPEPGGLRVPELLEI